MLFASVVAASATKNRILAKTEVGLVGANVVGLKLMDGLDVLGARVGGNEGCIEGRKLGLGDGRAVGTTVG